ncbi:MAG: outer membrane protein assembly factor BamE [Proteobacteria bacterium]|nr:outer membrane protein assembly factor BamE [Pseudomonadota bacterium]
MSLRRFATCAAAALALVLAACQTVDERFPTARNWFVYKLDINQGNYLTADQVAKLKPGMTQSQVKLALGTPLLIDPFHDDRWDYIYRFTRQGRLVEDRQFRVYFVDAKLARWEGDEMPKSAIEINRIAAQMAIDQRVRPNKGPLEALYDWFKNIGKKPPDAPPADPNPGSSNPPAPVPQMDQGPSPNPPMNDTPVPIPAPQ